MNSRDSDPAGALIATGDALRQVPVAERARELARVTAAWSDPDYPPRIRAVKLVAWVSGYSPEVLDEGFRRVMCGVTEDALLRWWNRSGSATEIPRLAAILPAVNIPIVAIPPIVACLLAGVPALVRPSTSDVFTRVFMRVLGENSPILGAAIRRTSWKRGDFYEETRALAQADRILIFGSDETIALMEQRYPGRVRGYGTSVSLGYVGKERLGDPWVARALAMDVAIWDQGGCLSPQAVYVEGDFENAVAFAGNLAEAMEEMEQSFPARKSWPHEAAAARARRTELELALVLGETLRVFEGMDGRWTVAAFPTSGFRSGTDRFVPVLPVSDLDELALTIRPTQSQLQCAGIAVAERERDDVTGRLLSMGFSFVTDLGKMQDPPIDWRNKGHDLIRDLLESSPVAGAGRAG